MFEGARRIETGGGSGDATRERTTVSTHQQQLDLREPRSPMARPVGNRSLPTSARSIVVAVAAVMLGVGLACQTGVPAPGTNPNPGGGNPAPQPIPGGGGQNAAPVLTFLWPGTNITIQDGTSVFVQYRVQDSTDTVRVSLLVDPDANPSNGNEIVLATGIQATPPIFNGVFEWNTTGFPPATYFVRGTADDQVNAVVRASAIGTVTILPRPGDPPGGGGGGGGGTPPNEVPQIFVSTPSQPLQIDAGAQVRVDFTFIDRDNDKTVTFFADPDAADENGNETMIFGPQIYTSPTGTDSFIWDTTGIAPGTYRVVGEIDDGVAGPGRPARSAAPALVTILDSGTGLPSVKPQVIVDAGFISGVINDTFNPPIVGQGAFVLLPRANRGVRNGDEVEVRMVLRNAEVQESLTILVYLDTDTEPSNNNLSNPNGTPGDPLQQPLILVSQFAIAGNAYPENDFFEPLPGIVLDETDPTDPLPLAVPLRFPIDTSVVPVRTERDELGRPLGYFIRVVVDDGHTDVQGNPDHRVSGYSDAPIYVQRASSGTLDLRDLNKFAGATFHGVAPLDFLGSAFAPLRQIGEVPDLFLDIVYGIDTPDTDDFMIVARYGTPRNRINVGTGYAIFGRRNIAPFGRFAGVNSVAGVDPTLLGEIRGSVVASTLACCNNPVAAPAGTIIADPDHPGLPWSGITSVTTIGDVTGDQMRDVVVGLPYHSGLFDAFDPDPCDTADNPDEPLPDDYYNEGGFPYADPGTNDDPTNDDIGCFDEARGESIWQGYVFALSGAELTANNLNDLQLVGQREFRARPLECVPDTAIPVPDGARFRGGAFEFPASVGPTRPDHVPMHSLSQFGYTVTTGFGLLGDPSSEELVVSAPLNSAPGGTIFPGAIFVIAGADYLALAIEEDPLGEPNCSFPNIVHFIPRTCNTDDPYGRRRRFGPTTTRIYGAADRDGLGFATAVLDFNQDGANDILCGAPGTDLPATDAGTTYVLFGQAIGFGEVNLAVHTNFPRIEIRGLANGDGFGMVQEAAGDVNGDRVADIIIGSKNFDNGADVNAGFAGVVFGSPTFSTSAGAQVFSATQIGTAGQLNGVRFFGAAAGAMAGASVAGAGDFNRDNYDDILIACPGESRTIQAEQPGGGTVLETRRGVAYLVFGGPHIVNQSFNLSQVGTAALPGMIFISPYKQGTGDEAPLEVVAGIGDVDGDGFDDIAIGAPKADLVFPLIPAARRDKVGEAYIVYGNNVGSNNVP